MEPTTITISLLWILARTLATWRVRFLRPGYADCRLPAELLALILEDLVNDGALGTLAAIRHSTYI
jgi:hypothetical protein